MPDCPFVITGPQKLGKGETATYQLAPVPDGAVCSVQWSINGQPARASNTYVDLYLRQVGFDEITVNATGADPGANITAKVTCQGKNQCGPTLIPFVMGAPSPDDSIKGGNILFIVLLPFIVLVGVALLPVWIIIWIVDRIRGSDEEKHVKKAASELHMLLPTWFR